MSSSLCTTVLDEVVAVKMMAVSGAWVGVVSGALGVLDGERSSVAIRTASTVSMSNMLMRK